MSRPHYFNSSDGSLTACYEIPVPFQYKINILKYCSQAGIIITRLLK